MDFIHRQGRSVYHQRRQLGFQTWRLPQRKIRWRKEWCAGLCQCRFQGSKSERPLKYRVYSHIVRLEKRMVFLFSSLLSVRVTTISKAMQTAAISKTILCWYVLKSGIICKTYERKMLYSSFCPLYLCTFASDKSCLTETHRKSQNLRPLPSHYLTLWEKLISSLFLRYSYFNIEFYCKILNFVFEN